jgi:hypothetical protein
MTKAINTHTPSRRDLLTGTAALLAGATIAATPGVGAAAATPDAELIRLCGEYRDIELAWRGAFNRFPDTRPGDRDRELFQAPLRARQDEIAEALEEIPPARTLAGFQALARTLPLSAGEMSDGPEHFTGTEFWLAEKLIRDLTEARA